MATIKFRNVVKSFDNGKVTVIPDLCLEIEDKEFIVLVGPSGCGKSTTLRMIAGLEEITSGELYIDDRKVNDVAPKDRDIAMVFQSYALYPHMSVYKNMAFALKLKKMSKEEIDKKVRWAAKILEIDAKLRTEMRSQITSLHQKLKTTFVYVTHDQTEALTMATRIVVMDKGVIRQVDTPQALYNKPANMFVAGFIGSPAMNFFEGRVAGGKIRFSKYEFDIPDSKKAVLLSYEGKDVVIGIRPEHFTECADAKPKKNTCIMTVETEISEMTGSEANIYFTLNGKRYIASIKTSRKICIGDIVYLSFSNSDVHFFDKTTTNAIR